MTYRILVTGSREFPSPPVVYGALNNRLAWVDEWEYTELVVVHGDCPSGADKFAHEWAQYPNLHPSVSIRAEPHPADWDAHGKAAGPLRNQAMVNLGASVCLAFFSTKAANRGTTDCVTRAQAARIPIVRYEV